MLFPMFDLGAIALPFQKQKAPHDSGARLVDVWVPSVRRTPARARGKFRWSNPRQPAHASRYPLGIRQAPAKA